MGSIKSSKILYIALLLTLIYPAFDSFAKDTDIYDISVKQNCYILMDNSGSMDFGVYEHTVDYAEMFNYLFCLDQDGGDTACGNEYIYDTVNYSWYFYYNKHERRKIYLLKGNIGLTVTTVDGEEIAFTGDPADPDYLWYTNNMVDTHTMIDKNGNLSDDGSGNQRLTVNNNGYIRLDGQPLPLGQDIKIHEFKELYDGSVVDNGFGGLINAPGYYFSGYEGVEEGHLNTAEGGDSEIYFFATGNWINMQAMYNLHYVTNNPNPKGASQGDPAWKYETVPIEASSWSLLSHNLDYPEGSGNYESGLSENDTEQTITQPGAQQIQVHFSDFDVSGEGDHVALKDEGGSTIVTYDNNSNPADGDGWSATVQGDTVRLCLYSDSDAYTGTGYTIDRIRVTYHKDSYLMQNRMDVAKDAMLYTLDEFYGKMNWGYATFKDGNGAQFGHSLNPNETDDVNTNSIRNAVEKVTANGPTPLGEALQDVFEKGYHNNSSALDNLLCRKNYVISLSDGFPSADTDWDRIGGKTFTDEDGDGWTADPYQYSDPPANYYDDVAHWMYHHSWRDKSQVPDPANSYENVITHHIAFGTDHPLMMDAAEESGGEYVTAYNKSQLVAAFYALALQITDAVSFTSPVASVDADNRIQHGDYLYLGLFLPQDSKSWEGNLKKFRFGNKGSEDPWKVYDEDGAEAVNASGEFLDNNNGFWGDENDMNDNDNYGSHDVTEDGVGEVLLERVENNFLNGNYYERNIKTYNEVLDSLVDIESNVTADDLGVSTLQTRNELVNYLYGYTNQAGSTYGYPLATRGWVLGAILHSRPVVIDYYNTDGGLENRYIAVGANDGMLHVFNDTTGEEELAFVPSDILPKLKNLPQENFVDTVDGRIRLYRKDGAPKYLIFGERRGGGNYWCLDVQEPDPANWSVKWVYNNPEISQSWSEPVFATIPTGIDTSTGVHTFQDVMIITGGYDAEEDNFPEPFEDADYSGSPFDNGSLDTKEWDKNDADHDINDNDQYDLYNPDMNEKGRGIFIVDIDDPTVQYYAASYDPAGNAAEQSMKWCFPASPSVSTTTYTYNTKESGSLIRKRKTNFLKAVYATDIYANVFKIKFNFESQYNDTGDSFSVFPSSATDRWSVNRVFSANPSSYGNSVSSNGEFTAGTDGTVQGLKAFYSPALSWGGACDYFDKGNYRFNNASFYGTKDIASIYFGTGDREHPTYTMKKDRFYAVYDDTSVTCEDGSGNEVVVSTAPYKEADLINLSCDELDEDTTLTGTVTKNAYRIALKDDPYFDNSGTFELEDGIYENDAKGWYIVLADQGDSVECSHCNYASSFADENHDWEKVLSKTQLFAENLYFTTYQPDISDICNPNGNGFTYSLNYCDATAAYSLSTSNSDEEQDVTDRYNKVSNIFGIPSGVSVVIRDGEAGGLTMSGGKMVGPKGGNDYEIDSPEAGLDLYYWLEGNTIE